MSEQMVQDDTLEQRLRTHYASDYGQPPAPSAIWEGISAELGLVTPDHTNTERVDRAVGDTTDHPTPVQPATRRDNRSWPRRLLPLVAAALVVAVFATLLLGPLGRSGHGLTGAKRSATATVAGPTATPLPVHALASDEVLTGASIADVQMLSADDGWAVGGQRAPGGCAGDTNGTCESLILHYSAGRWQEVGDPLPNVWLWKVSMASASAGWVGGLTTDPTSGLPRSVFLRYTNGRWTKASVPGMENDEIFKITMLSADEGWAIAGRRGTEYAWQPFFLWHYSSGVWSPADAPASRVITLSMVSPAEGWAAGTNDILHYQDGRWTVWRQKAPGVVTAIHMVSATDGWMAGVAPDGGGTDKPHALFMLHYDGHSWTQVPLPDVPGQLDTAQVSDIAGLAMVSPSEGYAVGDIGGETSLILHYASGAWRVEGPSLNMPLKSLSMASADEGWAIGSERNFADRPPTSVLLHLSGGAWAVYRP